MKKFKKLITIIMAAVLVLALSSCDLIQDAPLEVALKGVEAKNIRIGILYSSDYEREGTEANIQNQAIDRMWGTYGIAGTIPKNKLPVEFDKNTNKLTDVCEQKIKDSIISCVKESGCNVVLSTEPAFTEVVYGFASGSYTDVDNIESYKDIIFVCLDNTKKYESLDNFHCFYPDYDEAYALAGVAAATKLGKANIALTEENEELSNAFKLGVNAVAPGAKVINGESIDTYGTVVTNWHIYYITLIENITLGKFSEMGDYYAGVETGFCDFIPAEDYESKDADANMTKARLNFTENTWDLEKAETIKF